MATLSKAEYLKRYMSDEQPTEKKKKRRKINKTAPHLSRSRIVDDDVDFKSLLPSNLENTLDEDVGDNEPTVADIIDERPDYIKNLEAYRDDNRWKVLGKGSKEETSDKKMRHDSDSDQSPVRKGRHDSDSDQSPVRKGRHDSDSDQSPVRKGRHDSDSDQSPVRKGRHDSDSDQSPVRKGRHDSDSDQSPVRKGRHDSDSDQSPVRKGRHDSDSDQSPVRKRKNDSSEKVIKCRHDSNLDLSPERKKQISKSSLSSPSKHKLKQSNKEYDNLHLTTNRQRSKNDVSKISDQSRPRKSRFSDISPKPHNNSGGRGHSSDSDQSPQRKYRHSDSDQSPQRMKWSNKDQDIKEDKMKKTLAGKKAGLSSANDMKEEARKLKMKEEQSFRMIGDENLGKNAATVFRDKSGKRRNLKDEREKTEEELAREETKQAKYKEWGQGLKQRENQAQILTEHLHEMSKPLARYKDDEDLDKMLKDQDRAEDPMLAFIKKKSKVKNGAKVKEKPRYKGPAPPPNRYNIMPGYRWDGIDRSNGFEKTLFSKISDKKATDHQAFKWSTEDM